jgi:hypothetical protein
LPNAFEMRKLHRILPTKRLALRANRDNVPQSPACRLGATFFMLRPLNVAPMPFRQDSGPLVSCLTFEVFALR